MKLTTGIVFLGMVAGTAWGQNPEVINNTGTTPPAVQKKHVAASHAGAANPAGSPAKTTAASAKKVSIRPSAPKVKPVSAHKKAQPKPQIAVENQKKPVEAKADAPKQINLAGRRDPFI